MYMATTQQEQIEEDNKKKRIQVADCIQYFISYICFNINEIIDYRIVINILIKASFYLYLFLGKEENRYEGQSFFFTTILWAIFDLFLFFDVYHYIKKGSATPKYRNCCYKFIDMIQSVVALAFFIIRIKNGFDDWFTILFLIIVILDLILDLFQLMYLNNFEAEEQQSPPSIICFYWSTILGTGASFAILIFAYQHYKEIEETEEANQISNETEQGFDFITFITSSRFIFISFFGEGVIVIFCFYLICNRYKQIEKMKKETNKQKIKEKQNEYLNQNSPSNSKVQLSFFYGIALGAFNYFYAILMAILALAYIGYQILKCLYRCLIGICKKVNEENERNN